MDGHRSRIDRSDKNSLRSATLDCLRVLFRKKYNLFARPDPRFRIFFISTGRKMPLKLRKAIDQVFGYPVVDQHLQTYFVEEWLPGHQQNPVCFWPSSPLTKPDKSTKWNGFIAHLHVLRYAAILIPNCTETGPLRPCCLLFCS